MMARYFSVLIFLSVLFSCGKNPENIPGSEKSDGETNVAARFMLLPPSHTGIDFSNRFRESFEYNVIDYVNLYNGGGVAAGDVNGDSLPDLYFSATFGSNKLYLNLGDLRFADVTEIAGVGATEGFKTGVAMADINGDGRLDIYSCRTSKSDDGLKNDHVFINKGNRLHEGLEVPYFEDQSQALGLADNSNTNHVGFIDYDRDGDLDIFLLNHRIDFEATSTLRLTKEGNDTVRVTAPSTPFESNRLFRNDRAAFTDVTEKAGLRSSAFGLSVTAADLNRDGWIDLYVANDFIEPDRIYINNRDGTFTDHYEDYLKHSSQNSMGTDVADINNDALDDIVVLDMKAEDPFRYKMLHNVMKYDRYNLLLRYGYGRQVGRNVLQLNNGNNTFSDIGQFAGVAATDWSWGALVSDFDNDGWKDMYVSNGYRRDVTNEDYLNYTTDSLNRLGGISPQNFSDIYEVLKLIPEERISNYLYLNNHKLGFMDATKAAGMDHKSFSNGVACADLDRDGDLDLVVNNMEDPAFIYRNDITGNHWLQIDIEGKNYNTDGIGAEVTLYSSKGKQFQRMMPCRGFFSSSEPILHFGLGNDEVVDSLVLQWPDGSKEIMRKVYAGQRLIWRPNTGSLYKDVPITTTQQLFTRADQGDGWLHGEDNFVDFKRERLLPYMLSAEGPCISTGDVNGDKIDDLFVGNGKGYPSALYLQGTGNAFSESSNTIFAQEMQYESCGSLFKDLDGDGDLDLLVLSGGNSAPENDPSYATRYYINDGQGVFSRSADFPFVTTNGGALLAFDYDQDGDEDIFIGGRCIPGRFPLPPKSYLLRNDGGKFIDITEKTFPEFSRIGMITDMEAADLDGDSRLELIIAGEWMPVSVFSFTGNSFENQTAEYGLEKSAGMWKSISVDDLDGNGTMDIVAGNLGSNHRLIASESSPLTLISDDFDDNGSQDPVICFYHNGKLYPYPGRDAIIAQVPVLKKKYVRYSSYARETIEDIFGKDKIQKSLILRANTLETACYLNKGQKMTKIELPVEAQLSPVFDILIRDFNGDGLKDILMAGNFSYSEIETAEMDAGNGVLLIQKPDRSFAFIPNAQHGFWAQQEVRELKVLKLSNGEEAILTGNNKGRLEVHVITSAGVVN